MNSSVSRIIFLLTCPDQKGLVSKISGFLFKQGGNIISLHEHVETDEKIFFCRIVVEIEGVQLKKEEIEYKFVPIAVELNATWSVYLTARKIPVAVFVSKHEHCLQEILWRHTLEDYPVNVQLIISNHPDLRSMADHYQVPFYVFPITRDNKQEQEKKEIFLLKEHQIDTVILARYMQILSPLMLNSFPNKIINIHHSFLPAFAGGNPYQQAFERGVKIIGATSHYVTDDLDEGPIIEQDIIRISHRDSVRDLVRKGKDLERIVLAKALFYHAEHRVLVNGKKTIVFD